MVENHFADVESARSGQLLHVPSQPALFHLLREPGGLLSSCEFGKKCAWMHRQIGEPEAEVKTAQSRVTKIQWQR